MLPITQAISDATGTLVEKYAPPHSVRRATALIAGAAMSHALPLLTANTKHFSAVAGLRVLSFKP